MNKFLLFISIFLISTSQSQTYDDGCMDMTVISTRSWNEEFEDPYFSDESSWQWYVADNSNVDGQGYFGGGCLQQGGHWQIGWWNHSDYNMHNFSYGTVNGIQDIVPEFLNLRGRYEGDDCGGHCDHNTGGFLTCFGDQDDYIFNDLVSSFIDYRSFGPPNSANSFQRFTTWHGSADYGGEFTVNYTSPRPHTVTASNTSICSDGSNGAVTLSVAGAVYGGTYNWYKGSAFTFIGTGATLTVDPIADAGGGASIVYHAYTNNGGVNSLCYNEVTIEIINCDFNCTTVQRSTPTGENIPQWTNNYNYATLTTNTFPTGSYITDVNVTGIFQKAGSFNQIGFELLASVSGASCTSTSLVNTHPNSGHYAGVATSTSSIVQTFDEASSLSIASNGINPVSNPLVNPVGDLDCFNWSNPNRTWNFVVDHKDVANLEIIAASVEVCACRPPDSAFVDVYNSSSIDICESTGGSLDLLVSGQIANINVAGYGDEVRWFTDNCYGTYVGSGNPLTIVTPTNVGTYTYFANYYLDGVPCDNPNISGTECQSLTIVVHPEPTAGSALLSGDPLVDICINTDPGTIFLVGQTGGTIVGWQSSNDGGITWTNIVNTNASYAPGLMATAGTFFYRAVITGVGCGTIFSDFVELNVYEEPNAGTTFMITQGNTYCSDSIFRIGSVGSSGSLTWQLSDNNGLSYLDIPGQSTSDLTYTLTNNTLLPADYLFRLKASNNPCSDDFSNPPIAITIFPAPQSGVLSMNQDICEGDFANDLTLTNAFGDSVIWEIDTNINFTTSTNLGTEQVIYGLDNTLSSATMGLFNTTTYIKAKVFNAYCGEVESNIVTITVYSQPVNNIDSNQILCEGEIPDTLHGALVTGGNGIYTYQWQSSPLGLNTWSDVFGETNPDFYTINYTSSYSFRRIITSGTCMNISNTVDVIFNPNPTITNIVNNNLTCNGASDGSISITSLHTDSFSIDSGITFVSNSYFPSLDTGTYHIVLKNNFDCQLVYANNPIIILEALPIIIDTTNVNPSCANSGNGSIEITATNGIGVLSYSLNGGATQTSNVFNNLNAGTYNILVSDANGCTATSSVILSDLYNLSLNVDSTVNTSCLGQSDGEIYLGTVGGVAPFSFSLDNVVFQADSVFTGLAGGLYTVFVTDTNGCTASASTTLTESPDMLIVLDSVNNVLCNGDSTGSAYVSVSGGTGSYSYSWNNGMTSQNIENVPEGSYNLVVSSGACSSSLNVTINEPTILNATIVNVFDVTCNGGSNGGIDVSVSGGTTPYTFLWSNGDTLEDLQNVSNGTYTLNVVDGNNCTASVSTTVNENSSMTVLAVGSNSSCVNSNNGSITVNVTGGQAPYNYSLNGGSSQTSNVFNGLSAALHTIDVIDDYGCTATGTVLILNDYTLMLDTVSVSNVTCAGQGNGEVQLTTIGGAIPFSFTINGGLAQADSLFTGLSAGLYNFEVIDVNGCSSNVSVQISENPALTVVIDSISDLLCFGDTTGAIFTTTTGGDGNYTYAWSNGMTIDDITNVTSGTYLLNVNSGGGCSTSTSATISSPTELIVALNNIQDVACNGDSTGMIDVIVLGGTQGYSFDWNDGTNTVSTSKDLTNAPVGNYTLTVTDTNLCTNTFNASITENTALNVSLTITNSSCENANNGRIQINASGGQVPYLYAINNGTNQANSNFENLSPGTYTITVTDGNGCITELIDSIIENLTLTATIQSQDILCYGNVGSATVVVSGGDSIYTYFWSNFDTAIATGGFSEGMISVIVTDGSGCSVQVFDTINAPQDPLSISAVIQNVSCFGGNNGSIVENISGGTAPYTIVWTPTIGTNLTAGTYIVNVIDTNGCTAVDSFVISEPMQITNNLNVTNPSCYGEETGMIVVSTANGVLPYTYSWNTTPVQTGQIAINLAGDTEYILTTTDGNGCVQYDTAQIVYPTEMIVSTIPTSVSCISVANGSVTVATTNGNSPFQYELNGFLQADSIFNNLDVGSYVVFVEDANNCTASASFDIFGTSNMTIELEGAGENNIFTSDNLFIVRGEEVDLQVNLLNDTGNQIVGYNWNPIEIDSIANPSFSPIDDVTVVVEVLEMINGATCSIFDTLKINVSQDLLIFIPTAFSPNDEGVNNFFEINILGAKNIGMQIFNRWGELVFDNPDQGNGPSDLNDPSLTDGTNPRGAWDGKYNGENVPTGSYAYKIDVTYFDGRTKTISGSVTIIR